MTHHSDEIAHDPRCGGYGGWWASSLDGGAVGWAVDPKDEYDGVGYTVCQCMIKSSEQTPSDH